jgi:uncharacterized Zn-binding protein involved in type VI secretion
MPGAARCNLDTVATGIIRQGANNLGTVRVNGFFLAIVTDDVDSHGSGSHANATLATGSSTVRAYGRAVCRLNDTATCGHIVNTSSTDVVIGG